MAMQVASNSVIRSLLSQGSTFPICFECLGPREIAGVLCVFYSLVSAFARALGFVCAKEH
jgi:hypothetical protein